MSKIWYKDVHAFLTCGNFRVGTFFRLTLYSHETRISVSLTADVYNPGCINILTTHAFFLATSLLCLC